VTFIHRKKSSRVKTIDFEESTRKNLLSKKKSLLKRRVYAPVRIRAHNKVKSTAMKAGA
jgi:hypothetical protein